MKRYLLLTIALLLLTRITFGQSIQKDYYDFVKRADSLHKVKDFKSSANTYTNAFKANNWQGLPNDMYNAACAWALSGVPDSAFFQLESIATKANYANYSHVIADTDLESLHEDKRWNPLIEKIKQNNSHRNLNFEKSLALALDSIYTEDQMYRQQIDEIRKNYGSESNKMKAHWKLINKIDSVNLTKVKEILDRHGWLGADAVGAKGSITIFLVIQHADQATQEKYLPMMREAVKNGKAQGSALALLEDRVALGQGKRQIYGSQISQDPKTKLNYVLPLIDPDNVDKRRASVGLEPMSQYVDKWQIKWDVENYKKKLSRLEKKLKLK